MDVIQYFCRIAEIVMRARAQNPVTGDSLPDAVQKGFKLGARHVLRKWRPSSGTDAGSPLYPNGLDPRGEPKPGQRFKIVH